MSTETNPTPHISITETGNEVMHRADIVNTHKVQRNIKGNMSNQ